MKLLFFIVVVGITLKGCKDNDYVVTSGKTMGTYYSIQYKGDDNFTYKIDSILNTFISAASTYDSLSEISEFNKNGVLNFRSPYLRKMLSIAKEVHAQTCGAFEPTLMPLINAHGFGYTKQDSITQSMIDSLLALVSFDYIMFDSIKMVTKKKGVQLDLSAMGEGFAIDLIADFLEQKQVRDYKVEIGGEMKCKGKNPRAEQWLIGIENPMTHGEAGKLLTSIRLKDAAVSTSGGYRKFYVDKNARKQSHILDPRSGKPVQNSLVSVTIKHRQAVLADAIATSCMVMGYDSAVSFLTRHQIAGLISFEKNGTLKSWKSQAFD